ncbi:MAG: 1-acyl-sn-glycerol-3-phosphate acyltransferase [Clostridiales bacterium]|nr:1-acyl-sn-glycerol-3-phosphate acyltransferase [Clostridiales bacterium]
MNKAPFFYRFMRGLVKPLLKLLYRYRIKGAENLPSEGKCILCPNHLHAFDPAFIIVSLKRQVCFMAKAELFKNRFLGFLLKRLGAFPVVRGAGDGKALEEAERILNSDKVFGIFIEGSRSKTGELLRPRAGAALMAYKTGAPVVPCCITPQKGKLKLFSKTLVTYGKPITTQELGFVEGVPAELRNASRLIMEKITEMRQEHLEELENG